MPDLTPSVASLSDPVAAFIEAACVPRDSWHGSETLEQAELILARYPQVAQSNIHTAAILADESAVRGFLARDPRSATATGGPHEWDALTHLYFSRYLMRDKSRSDAFVRTAQALLEAGASAKTGWIEMIDHPNPRPTFESAVRDALSCSRNSRQHGAADPSGKRTVGCRKSRHNAGPQSRLAR